MDLIELFRQLLNTHTRPTIETSVFRKLKHNRDLCPLLWHRCESILAGFRTYQGDVYDIQGLSDNGSDVIVRRNGDDGGFICFQLKSHDDLLANGVVQKVKAQYADTIAAYQPMLHFFVVLACDGTNANLLATVRAISAHFVRMPCVTTVVPERTLALLTIPEWQLDAFVKTQFSERDIVLERAARAVAALSKPERALLLVSLWNLAEGVAERLSVEDYSNSRFVADSFRSTPIFAVEQWPDEVRLSLEELSRSNEIDLTIDELRPRLAMALERMEGDFIQREGDNFACAARDDDARAILAIM